MIQIYTSHHNIMFIFYKPYEYIEPNFERELLTGRDWRNSASKSGSKYTKVNLTDNTFVHHHVLAPIVRKISDIKVRNGRLGSRSSLPFPS